LKILDRYILFSFLRTFASVFIILMFIFILQSVWLYISELAGKGLDVFIILKFLWFVSPKLIPLVLPLTILVTSLMVFGSLSENYEFAAMKSTGISLQRAMRSLTYFILLLSVTAFFFANNVIPYSEYKWLNLRRNIQQFKPSMVIAEGQFNQIGEGFNIKVSEKYGDNDQFLKDVVIHKKEGKAKQNNTVIIAETGELTSEENSNTLSLILRNGNYYDDVQPKDQKKKLRKPFAKSYFEEYTINIDLTELNNKDVEKENKLSNHNMYNVSELRTEIDSLSTSFTKNISSFAENMHYRTGATKHFERKNKAIKNNVSVDTLLNLFKPNQQAEIIAIAINNINSTIETIKSKKVEFIVKNKRINKYEIALHEKYALGVACIILFFVGAPLGAIIRKGGMGLPMVIAILLFLTYHFIGIFAKNSAEDGTLHPFIATWLSTLILLPLGIWLTIRATTDQGIIDMDSFYQRIKRLFKKKEKNS
jgi:lipopolysaccharide export system permease protein